MLKKYFYRTAVGSDDSENEKLKAKTKNKKSVDEDIKEVSKNIKNISISKKLKKKQAASSDGK